MLAFAAAILIAATNLTGEDEINKSAQLEISSELVFEEDLEAFEEADAIVLEESLLEDFDSETADLED